MQFSTILALLAESMLFNSVVAAPNAAAKTAIPATSSAVGHTDAIHQQNSVVYATFYTDDACTQNPSIAFSTSNQNCIVNMGGHSSIYFQTGVSPGVHQLVSSPDADCSCQNDCLSSLDYSASGSGYAHCFNMTGHPAAASYRFQTEQCAPNNCP